MSITLTTTPATKDNNVHIIEAFKTTTKKAPASVQDSNKNASAPITSSNESLVTGKDNNFTTSSIITKTTAAAVDSIASIDSMQHSWINIKKTLFAMEMASSLRTSGSGARQITEACMQCICETTTQCRPSTCVNNVDCDIFRLSHLYWLDAAYDRYVNNIYCATRTIAAYIGKYTRDCNHHGSIECLDHIALHLLGPNGCVRAKGELLPVFTQRMKDCLLEYT